MKKINPEVKKNFFKRVKDLIFVDFKIKVICLSLAITTFVIISYIQTNEKVFSCPLTVVGLKENFIISNQIPDKIKVTVKNRQNILDKIVESDFKIRLNLSDIKSPDTYTIKLDWDVPKSMQSLFTPLLFTSVELNPEKINLNIERVVEKNVPIMLNSIGEVTKGYIIKSKSMDAYYVRIQGPENIINGIKYIETEKINIEGEIDSFKRIVNLVSPSPLIKFIDKTKVEVSFEISKDLEFITYRFNNLSIHNLNTNFKIEILTPNNFIVQISGLKEDIKKITKENIILSIDCSSVYYPGDYSFRIEVSLPRNINLVTIKPEVVRVSVKLKN
ncbi:MAG TPA: CdaR family protein [Spirochaetota bacterium]|nr:CdaR family protein [Spirochaetota bacterium]HOL56599.1 CdaR family protein [Spirochaetota bacterium]HPP04022.1 CdaR family protein [Spirochaetota bacterium]